MPLVNPQKLAIDLLQRDYYFSDTDSGWSMCMQDTGCKVGAYFGIVIGSIILLYAVISFIAICCCGATLIGMFCCGCGRSRRSDFENQQQFFNTPVYPAQPPMTETQMYPPPIHHHHHHAPPNY